MSNYFDAVKRNPALAIGLTVLTLGIPLIGYLGYRLVKWISHTESFEKVSNCFKKYCCCTSKTQESNTTPSEESENPRLPKERVHVKKRLMTKREEEGVVRDEVRAFFEKIYKGERGDSISEKLKSGKNTFKDQHFKVQYLILANILTHAFSYNDMGYYEVLDEYLTSEILGTEKADAFMKELLNQIFDTHNQVKLIDGLSKAFAQGGLGTFFSKFNHTNCATVLGVFDKDCREDANFAGRLLQQRKDNGPSCFLKFPPQ